jgi:hypothetical protein
LNPEILNPEIFNLNGTIVFFPVRHHSPAAARFLRQWIESVRPAAVLIEGPADFNDRLDELKLPHELPIAIYSYLQYGNGMRRGAFYPFCIYSPEWQALKTAFSLNIPVEFIDRPWAELAFQDCASHRYADGNLAQNQYVSLLCQKVGVEDFDGLWDTLFEIDPHLSIETYLERCHRLCFNMRTSHLTGQHINLKSDRFREAFMVEKIRFHYDRLAARKDSTLADHPLLVVTGGFHSYALFSQIYHLPFETESDLDLNLDLDLDLDSKSGSNLDLPATNELNAKTPEILQQGIALTPYAYDRLDSLTGYESGMANPGFYHQIWNDRGEPQENSYSEKHTDPQAFRASLPRHPSYQVLLAEIVCSLREKKQQGISSADLIAVETMAKSLANLRGHAEVWRQDLIDGILGALVKEELNNGLKHPLLEAVYQVFRGNDRGRLATGTSLPPLVADIQLQLKKLKLESQLEIRLVDLDLYQKPDLERSQFLYQLRGLGITGYSRLAGTDFIEREDLSAIWEQWEIRWSPEFEANCIEAAIYGSSLTEAVSNRLLERAKNIDRAAGEAALLLLEACLMGLPDLPQSLEERFRSLIRQDSQFLQVSQALGHLLYLYRYDTVLQHIRSEIMALLLQETFHRSLWLLETLGTIGTEESRYLQGLRMILEVFERCQSLCGNDRSELQQILNRVSQDTQQHSILRGGAIGALWRLGTIEAEQVFPILNSLANPEQLGDFLAGLFNLAREVIQRYPKVAQQIDSFIMGYSHQRFLEALPALRLAFGVFSPREKYNIAMGLFPTTIAGEKGFDFSLEIDPTIATAAFCLEIEIANLQQYYGL